MPAPFASSKSLARVAEAKKRDVDGWKEGRHLEASTGRSIDELHQRAVADRLSLAIRFRRQADRMLSATPPMYRDAVSRYYYAMYHSMRAVVFYIEQGDDFEAHKELPKHTPQDFTDATLWQNALKDARERRNAADYEPYPKSDAALKKSALASRDQAHRLLQASKGYLAARGCAHL